MTTLADILSLVLAVVPKHDKETLVRTRINSAINLISKSGYFWRDIVENTITATDGVDVSALTQSITLSGVERKFIYVKSTTTTEKPITLISPERLVKNDCAGILPIAYVAGSTLHIKHEELATSFDLAYYTSPTPFELDGTDDANTNWILTQVPDLVVDLASAYILNIMGDTEDSKRILDLSTVLRGTYIRDFVDSHE
jgi:hypothetical protein